MSLAQKHSPIPNRSLIFLAAALFIISFITAGYFQVQPSIKRQQRLLERYIQTEEQDANKFLTDSALLRKLVLQTESLNEFKKIEEKNYGVFLFAETINGDQELLFWNNQEILPPTPGLDVDGKSFRLLPNGWHVVHKKTLQLQNMSNTVVAYVVIPVLNKYYLETDYLDTKFVHDGEAIKKISLSEAVSDYPIRGVDNGVLFYIKKVAYTNLLVTDTVTLLLRLAALLFALLYAHLFAAALVKRGRTFSGILFLAVAIIGIRGLIYFFPAIITLRQFELFDPLIYATNDINRSLGDLLLNAAFFCWVVLFTWYSVGPIKRLPKILSGKTIYPIAIASVFILIFATFQFANVVRGLVANSKISFNVNDFFSIDIYTLVGFVVLALLCLGYYFFSRLLFRFILPAFKGRRLFIYFFIAVAGLSFLTVRTGNEIVLFHLPVLIWLIIYTLLLSQEQFIINSFRATVAGVLFWIFVFSASLAVIILQGNRENELRIRKGVAEKYDQLTDPSAERIMSIAITYLDNRFLQKNFSRFQNSNENQFLRDSILRSNFTGYSNRYDTRIYVFDQQNNPVNNFDTDKYDELNTIFTSQSRPTGIPDLYFHETSYDRFNYITKRVVEDSAGFKGSFFIVSTPKEYGSSDALYPELFRVLNRNDVENSPLYSYAIYNNRLLRNSSAKYPFQITLAEEQVPVLEFEQRTNGGNNELWYKANPRKIVVIARKQNSLLESITLFSCLFCAFLFMVGFIQMISFFLRFSGKLKHLNVFAQLNIRTQIHGTVIFISVLSFLVIGAATISFFIDRYNRNNEDRLSLTAGIMVKEMERELTTSFSDTSAVKDSAVFIALTRLVNEAADIHNVDVNVYDLNGDLEHTSDEEVYNKGILSKKMHPLAYYHLSRLREVQRVQQERLSSLDYLSIYSAVRNDKGEVKKYINIPYFSSQLDLKQEISNFLVTIINLNAFIFLIAGIVALFITNKITQSFSVIGAKMRDITLSKTNEEIVWERNDEIGELVRHYNKMVHELEKSAEALAKSEREGAWREMARQVAHEIKNPLTPMKLTIQYLQKAINTNQPNVNELTTNVATTLIEQIDHLSKIAADFSQFANIGNKKIELLDLHAILGSLVDLFGANPQVTIHWHKVEGSIILKADKTQMNRLFTNLFANALEAAGDKHAVISIAEQRKKNKIIITVEDNGDGIPEEIQSKIFTPNFTTKTSGTGLGLAMCKSIIEQFKGEIWFETTEGKGTKFFVQLNII